MVCLRRTAYTIRERRRRYAARKRPTDAVESSTVSGTATPQPVAGRTRRRRMTTAPDAPVPLLDEPPPIDWDGEDWTFGSL